MALSRRLVSLLVAAPIAFALLPGVGSAATPVASPVAEPVLGSPSYQAPYGEGWGTVKPTSVYNGGDPAGDASNIRWRHWGADDAIGHGVIPIFRPGGGYYAHPGKIVLWAEDLGTCPDGTHGYTRLYFRVAHRPGHAPGKYWHPWASNGGDICTSP